MADYIIGPGRIIKEFSLEETQQIENNWLDIFGKNKQGLNLKTYKWHVFSSGRFPALEGEKALREYLNQTAPDFVVLPNDVYPALLTDARPDNCDLSDYFVFPSNLAWVMAFTHEAGLLGPYFARHPRYDLLNAQNLALVKKANEKLNAIKKGWAA